MRQVFLLQQCEIYEGNTFIGVFYSAEKAMAAGDKTFAHSLSDKKGWKQDSCGWERSFAKLQHSSLYVQEAEMNKVEW